MLQFTIIISINLGIINLLPIPLLDGGHIFLNSIEMLTRRKINAKVLNFIKDVDDSYSSILIFTHNNTCNNLVVKFTNQYLHVPTCGILIFEFNVSLWKDISDSDISYYFPKSFR